ncbi:hypothetical protein BDV98DRAFT_607882 [Pterulicium gracile]|uniref:Splicing factor YJU2 n=1 Tax=Pterulicium gracile TaxID=1884261 RepID=A0A5C3Q4V2_9AGAR|nr:hypothetical protein BDV98DRAFT_607882 [Pterula gracilis]
MAERKVLNKYFPPDFDPSLIPRRRGPKNSQQVVRLMAPFSMRCNTCGEYIYKGKKFNARKETVEDEDYHGIKIFRFYIKCTLCSAEITFKTDPKNTDYLAEHGASRNFEPWREEAAVDEEERLAKFEAEENDPMKVLENRTQDSKREMDILDALQDIRARNARNERVGNSASAAQAGMEDGEDVWEKIKRRRELQEEEEETEELRKKREEENEDERLVREVFSKVAGPSSVASAAPPVASSSSPDWDEVDDAPKLLTVKRKATDIQPDLDALLGESTKAIIASHSAPSASSTKGPSVIKKRKVDGKNALGIKLVKKSKGKAVVA